MPKPRVEPWPPPRASVRSSVGSSAGIRSSHDIKVRLGALRARSRRRQFAVHAPALALGALAIILGALLGMLALVGVLGLPQQRHIGWLILRVGAVVVLIALWPTRNSARLLVAGSIACAAAAPLPFFVNNLRGLYPSLTCDARCPSSCASGEPLCLASLSGIVQAVVGVALWLAAAARLMRVLAIRPALSTHTVLARHWSIIGQTLLLQGVLDLAMLTTVHLTSDLTKLYTHDFAGAALLFASAGQETVLGALLSKPGVRVVVQAWLAAHGKALTSATGIAQLLGARRDIEHHALSLFMCITADKVTIDDFRTNDATTPIPSGRCEPACFGQVDAFVSHSWHDSPEAKFAALEAYRQDFKAACGREPRLWIDRLAISQTKITDSLPCLPIFLAGCDTLLLLCGDSYLHRLWCVIEIFAFLQMGGTEAQIVPIPLMPSKTDDVNEDSLRSWFRPRVRKSESARSFSWSSRNDFILRPSRSSLAGGAQDDTRGTQTRLIVHECGPAQTLSVPSEMVPRGNARKFFSVKLTRYLCRQLPDGQPQRNALSATMQRVTRLSDKPSVHFSLSSLQKESSAYEPELYERLFMKRVECFDVRHAECSVAEDKERLSAMIEAGFVNLDNFNRIISGTLMRSLTITSEARRRRSTHHRMNSTASSSGAPPAPPGRGRVREQAVDLNDLARSPTSSPLRSLLSWRKSAPSAAASAAASTSRE